MADEKLLTIRDVSQLLGITEREVIDFAESGELPAYKVAGVYLRFKREQVEEFRATLKPREPEGGVPKDKEYSLKDKIRDFFYFNDFYILAVVLIVLILILIFRNIE